MDKSGSLARITQIVSFAISLISITIAVSVYLENRRVGELEIFVPSRYGILRGTHQSNTSDKLLISFSVHNNGNRFRDVRRVHLELKDDAGARSLLAIGRFDQLKELRFQNRSLTENPNYFLLSSLPLDRGQFATLHLLFYFENDPGWVTGGQAFSLKRGTYTARLVIDCTEPARGGGYEDQTFRSSPFRLSVKYEPPKDLIDTFTDITPL